MNRPYSMNDECIYLLLIGIGLTVFLQYLCIGPLKYWRNTVNPIELTGTFLKKHRSLSSLRLSLASCDLLERYMYIRKRVFLTGNVFRREFRVLAMPLWACRKR